MRCCVLREHSPIVIVAIIVRLHATIPLAAKNLHLRAEGTEFALYICCVCVCVCMSAVCMCVISLV